MVESTFVPSIIRPRTKYKTDERFETQFYLIKKYKVHESYQSIKGMSSDKS
jgi:hypothetical protein